MLCYLRGEHFFFAGGPSLVDIGFVFEFLSQMVQTLQSNRFNYYYYYYHFFLSIEFFLH